MKNIISLFLLNKNEVMTGEESRYDDEIFNIVFRQWRTIGKRTV